MAVSFPRTLSKKYSMKKSIWTLLQLTNSNAKNILLFKFFWKPSLISILGPIPLIGRNLSNLLQENSLPRKFIDKTVYFRGKIS